MLANVLLTRYGERVAAGLAGIARRAGTLSPEALADALIDLLLELQAGRQSAAALVDARSDAQLQKSTLRHQHRAGIAAILAATGRIPARRLELIAILVLQQLKSVCALADEQHTGRSGLLAELRSLLAGYLRSNWLKRTRAPSKK